MKLTTRFAVIAALVVTSFSAVYANEPTPSATTQVTTEATVAPSSSASPATSADADKKDDKEEAKPIDADTKAPAVIDCTVQEKDGKYTLIINVIDDSKIAKVTVNGKEATKVTGDDNKATFSAPVEKDGTYDIVLFDELSNGQVLSVTVKDGKEVETSTTPTTSESPAPSVSPSPSVAPTPVTSPTTTSAGTTVQKATITFTLNSKDWTIDGKKQPAMDVAPILEHDRVYLPIRYIATALGIDQKDIKWDAKAKQVTITHDGKVVKMTVGQNQLDVDGKKVDIDGAPINRDSRVYLPVSQVAKAFPGINITWDNTTKTATITR